MSKKPINKILAEKFPNTNAICVLTRETEKLCEFGFTKFWKINPERAKNFAKIIIVNIADSKGEYLISDITKVATVSEIISEKEKGSLSSEIKSLVDKDVKDFQSKSVFAGENLYSNFNNRIAIFFDKNKIEKGKIEEEFKSFANPVFYLEKQLSAESLENLKITNADVSNLLNIENSDLEFADGINLFIGENNIGKTGLLKFLYANIKAYENYIKLKNSSGERNFRELLSIKLQNTFQSDDKIGSIVCKSSDNELASSVQINNSDEIKFSFKKTTKFEVSNLEYPEIAKAEQTSTLFNAVFVPAKEILSISRIIEMTKNRFVMSGFDDTYGDLVNDIEPFFIKNIDAELEKIIKKIQAEIIEGEIDYDHDRKNYFYHDQNGHRYDLTMTAEGIKQLGVIPLLIRTGKIKRGTVLFMDEPDNNLNPKIIRQFTEILFALANAGVQIFISTHNYLFSQYISLMSEHKQKFGNIDFDSKFFALHKHPNSKTQIEQGNNLLEISNNLLLDEYVKLYDVETELENE